MNIRARNFGRPNVSHSHGKENNASGINAANNDKQLKRAIAESKRTFEKDKLERAKKCAAGGRRFDDADLGELNCEFLLDAWPSNVRVTQILENSARQDVNMFGDGRCGFYGIMAQIYERFQGKNLCHPSLGGNSKAIGQAETEVKNLIEAAKLTNLFTHFGDRQLNTDMLQHISNHYGRSIVLIGIETDGIRQIDVAIPGLECAISAADFDENFLDRVKIVGGDGDRAGAHLIGYGLTESSTFAEVATQLLLDPLTIGLLYFGMHFHAMLPSNPLHDQL
ncbi:MAG: hypothetical protein LBI61_02010 [Puniceicoccales bacterium]|nr:hypothetical protein [Puniceicoccales bacterium]